MLSNVNCGSGDCFANNVEVLTVALFTFPVLFWRHYILLDSDSDMLIPLPPDNVY